MSENHLQTIEDFIRKNKSFNCVFDSEVGTLKLYQKKDKKAISINRKDIEAVVERKDIQEEPFLQINFKNQKRILLTRKLIGFAPAACKGLDMNKLPRVVTTPDLLSVIEALESALCEEDSYEENFKELKLFFEAISCGAESVGFNVTAERLWVDKLISNYLISSSSSSRIS